MSSIVTFRYSSGLLAGLADEQHGLRDVLAGGAGEDEVARRLVEPLRDVHVLHAHLAGAAAAADVAGAGLAQAPRPGEDVDLAAVLAVLAIRP